MLDQQTLGPGDPTWISEYRVIARLGEGGQGVVYLALAPWGERVVVKLLREVALRDGKARARLAHEVDAARTVARFCTAQVIAADLDGDLPYVVSEYVPGPTLAELVRTSGPLAGAALDRLAVGTATALAAIHQARIVHRDVKPGNVVLGPDGPRVIDFGIAHDLAGDVTATGGALGTPAFTAPEQVGPGAVGPPADMFAWACTMTFAATGHSPFDAGTPVAQLHRVLHSPPDLTGVPAPLAAVVERCLAKHPALRPTAQQVLLELLGATRDDPTGAVRVRRPPASARTAGAVGRAPAPAWATRAAPAWAAGETTQALVAAGSVTTVLAELPARRPADRLLADLPPESWEEDDEPPPRRRVSVVVTALLLAVLLGGTAWWWTGSARRGATGAVAAARTGPSSGASAAASSGPPGMPALVVPAGFAGTWSGLVAQPPGARRTFPVSLTLTDGAGEGDLTLPSLGCAGLVDVAEQPTADAHLTLAEHTTADPRGKCAPLARIVLTPLGGGALNFFWQDAADPGNTASATLIKN